MKSFVNLSTRIRSNLDQYLHSRRVDKNYEKLVNLLIADKMKISFRYDTKEKVQQKGGVDDWMIPSELAVFADLYEVDRPDSSKGKSGWFNKNNNNNGKNVDNDINLPNKTNNSVQKSSSWQGGLNTAGAKGHVREPRLCFICNSDSHTYQHCSMKGKKKSCFP